MAHIIYENFVLESKLTDLLNTKMGVRGYMTIDNSLVANPGMKKTINVYTYTGLVEDLDMGEDNTIEGAVSYTPAEYEVVLSQQKFSYFDEEFMTDPKVVDMGMEGSATTMVNDLNTRFFAELAKATLEEEYEGDFSYDVVVDAIQKMNIEDESGLFLVIGTDLKATIRKDEDFKASRQGEILYRGQIGTISGVPVIVSKLVPEDDAYLATKEAVTLFIKKDSEIEQDRDAGKRKNSVILRKVHLVALTDATKVVKITPETI